MKRVKEAGHNTPIRRRENEYKEMDEETEDEDSFQRFVMFQEFEKRRSAPKGSLHENKPEIVWSFAKPGAPPNQTHKWFPAFSLKTSTNLCRRLRRNSFKNLEGKKMENIEPGKQLEHS